MCELLCFATIRRGRLLAEAKGFEPLYRLLGNRISSAGRYNHFDTLPYSCCVVLFDAFANVAEFLFQNSCFVSVCNCPVAFGANLCACGRVWHTRQTCLPFCSKHFVASRRCNCIGKTLACAPVSCFAKLRKKGGEPWRTRAKNACALGLPHNITTHRQNCQSIAVKRWCEMLKLGIIPSFSRTIPCNSVAIVQISSPLVGG